jgi:DNA-binding transcriptional LysR family regulator
MRLEWLDDILAVLDTGSLARAAERRFLTQSAFTRRVRMIEQSIGTTLFDRRRKPVTLMPGVQALEPELRELSARLRSLGGALRMSASHTRRRVTFVCQHAITATVSPRVVREIALIGETSVRVRSGNRDDCLMCLVSGEAEFAITYEIPGERAPIIPKAFEAVTLSTDTLVPVCTPALRPAVHSPEIPTVSYPADAFLGQVFDRMIRPRLSMDVLLASRAESALTLAILEFALNDIGVAWLPQSLVADHLARGRLVRLDDFLPTQDLDITMVRLRDDQSDRSLEVWQYLIVKLRRPTGLQSLPNGAPGPVQSIEREEE